MSFQPVAPYGGYAGWLFLKRTENMQRTAFAQSGTVRANAEHARNTLGSVTTADALLDDRRLLEASLGAYGLSEDMGRRHFIRTILSDGTADPTDLANRMADQRYRTFARDFGFGDQAIPGTLMPGFADTLADRFVEHAFEESLGNSRPELRLALNTERELPAIARRAATDRAGWYEVLGNPPIRKVFETAFGLPAAFAGLDLDHQIETLREKCSAAFGSSDIAAFSDGDRVDQLLRRYLARTEVDLTATAPGSVALALLSRSG